jgi:CRISPR-associated protein Csm5
MQTYELTTITPVHIGTGVNLSHIDGFYANGTWRRINLDKVLAAPSVNLNTLTIAMGERDFRWSSGAVGVNLASEQFCVYALPCPASPEEVEIREATKDVFSQPMIPGSSIKGAIRTALLWHLIENNDDAFNFASENLKNKLRDSGGRRPNRQWAGQDIERNVFGRSPNYDLMRAVQVSDTQTVPIDALEIGEAWTVTLDPRNRLVQKRERGQEYKTFVEQLRVGQRLQLSIRIDDFLFSDGAEKDLHFQGPKQEAINQLPAVCNQLAGGIIEEELGFFEHYQGLPEITNFYESLSDRLENLPDGAFLLQIGWGGGYNAKTVTDLLVGDDESEDLLMELRRHYRLGESRSRRGSYDAREFPKTRRVLYEGQRPTSPLGWVEIGQVG